MNSDGEISFEFPCWQIEGPSTASVLTSSQVPCVLFPLLQPFVLRILRKCDLLSQHTNQPHGLLCRLN